MGNLNKVLLIGRISQNIEIRTTPQGKNVVNTSLATNEYYKNQSAQRQERTEYHKIVIWERNAEIISQYCRKGSQIYVEGSLQTRKWQDKNGNNRYVTEVIVRNLQLLDGKQNSGQSQPSQQQNAPPQNQEYAPF